MSELTGRLHVVLACAVALLGPAGFDTAQEEKPIPTPFDFPCEGYAKGLRSGGNFGLFVSEKGSPFGNSWHLAEDVWLPAGTPVRSVADGIVRYSDFSPTWTDEHGRVHWNLGNVIVIEHALEPPEKDLACVCSIYVHLAADRRVAAGDRVTRGQVIGRIGADRSEENGRYPAHLHFGLHRGPYFQIPPAFEREVRAAAASKDGWRVGTIVLRGEVDLRRSGESDVVVTSRGTRESVLLSLLVGSTAPKNPPADIMGWCAGYGAKETLDEWLCPSKFLAAHRAK